jgi:hypothetical protein
MARAKEQAKLTIEGTLVRVRPPNNGKYEFSLTDFELIAISENAKGFPLRRMYRFLLSVPKALVIANERKQFPKGVKLKIEGRVSPNDLNRLNFVKILAVDGVDPRAWAERNGSPTVSPDVQENAQDRIKEQQKAEEEAMRSKAPPEPTSAFKTPQEAFERAMFLVRRQLKLKDPHLSKDDIFQMRDALNILAESAGL